MDDDAQGGREDVATLQAARLDPSDISGDGYALVVLEGPDRGASFVIDGSQGPRVLLGKSPACDFRLSDAHVSRRHAAIEPVAQRLRLADLGSSNGTYVDGLGIVEVYLRGGEIVRMGETALRVDRGQPPPSFATASAKRFGRVVGGSLAMRRIYPLCERLAAAVVPLVIEGETGTGKELLAEALHEAGPRAAGPFVVFDCTAVPPSLVESELFGHERGAFTGAVSTRKGVFELAHGGTLLIDEIGDLDITLQPKLLRALERSEIRRVGSERPIRVDVRVLAATRRDLDHHVQLGRFRDDLFHRLAVARIELPPLRRRHGDVTLLAGHFWADMGGASGGLTPDLLQRLDDHTWPGNVRELRNAVARRIALGELGPIKSARPPASASESAAGDFLEQVLGEDLPFVPGRQRVIDEFERRYVERVLGRHGGNVSHAAAASGIARRTLQIIRARQGK